MLGDETEFVVADTSVISRLRLDGGDGPDYSALLGNRAIALSYFVEAELRGFPDHAGWTAERLAALEAFFAECLRLPEPSAALRTWYGRAAGKRSELRLSSVSDNDIWIVADAALHGLPYMSHDDKALRIATGVGVSTESLLEGFA